MERKRQQSGDEGSGIYAQPRFDSVLPSPGNLRPSTDQPPASLRDLSARQSQPPPARGGRSVSVSRGALAALGLAVLEVDGDGLVVAMNELAERLTGFSEVEANGLRVEAVFRLEGETDGFLLGEAASELESGAWLEHRTGGRRAVAYSVSSQPDADEWGGARWVLVARDVTEEQLARLKLQRHTTLDTLTGVLNRRTFLQRLELALDAFQNAQRPRVLLLLDLDQFRLVNDTAGLDAGDAMLAYVASKLRESVGPHDLVGRVGDDQFAVLLEDHGREQGERTAERLRDRLAEFRFAWGASTFAVRVSVGVVPASAEQEGAAELLALAATTCRRAKRRGGHAVVLAPESEEQQDGTRRHALVWVARILSNLQEGKVRLYCQPILPLKEGGKPSIEVLFRTVEPNGTVRGPQDVVRAAERAGLMDTIDRFIIGSTLDTLAGSELLNRVDHVSINLSATTLKSPELLPFILDQLHRSKVPPSKLCFEITETAAVEHLAAVRWLMQELSSMGCRFSLDDFGSGMASYAYLRDLSVDYIKVDASFVEDVDRNELSAAIVSSIQHIAELVGAQTICEGVETAEVSRRCGELGAHYVQGYYHGRPRPLDGSCLDGI